MTDKEKIISRWETSVPCDKYPEHNTDSDKCWCMPYVAFIDSKTGNKVIVHKDFNA